MESLEQLDRLLGTWEKLEARERLCVLTYAMRILVGQKKFGPMTLAKKDWPYEAIEEALDSSVYLTAALNDRVELALARMVSEAEAEVSAPDMRLSMDFTRKEPPEDEYGAHR